MQKFILVAVISWMLMGSVPTLLCGQDEISTTLNAAKEAHSVAVKEAKEAFLNDWERAKEKLNQSALPTAEKVKTSQQLSNEKEAFLASWARPKHSLLKDATDQFQKSIKAARKNLEAAYDQAAATYDKQKDLESASRVLTEKAANQRRLAAMEEPQIVKITSAVSGKVIGVSEGALTPGTGLLQWRNAGVTDQSWQLIPIDDEWFVIRNRRSGMVMGVGGGSKDEGAAVIQWTQADVPDQHWKLVPVKERGQEAYMIVNRNSNKLLSLERESKDNGVKIIQSTLIENAPTQRWLLSK